VLTIVAIWLVSGAAFANHRDSGVLRIDIPVAAHGAQRLPIRRLILNQARIDLDAYHLRAVVIDAKPRSRGYAQLSVGGYRSPDYRLHRKDRVRIPSPARTGGKWQLALGPGTKIRGITAILEPRRRSTGVDSRYGFESYRLPQRWGARGFSSSDPHAARHLSAQTRRLRRQLEHMHRELKQRELESGHKRAHSDQRRDVRNDHNRADELPGRNRHSQRRHTTRI